MTKPIAIIVEDDPRLSDIFSETIRSAGYQIELFDNGRSAIERLTAFSPDLVVLDLHLPEVTGDRVLDFIRSQPNLTNTRVMLATADAMMASTLEDECDLVLLKPISVSQLRLLASRLMPQSS